VDLHGERVRRIMQRLLARAEAVGGSRARDYLAERLGRVIDRWQERRTGSARLAYRRSRSQKEQLTTLLERAGSGTRWTDLTVGMSMRETENEINLLVPAGREIFSPAYSAPEWTFTSRERETDEDETPDGDEFGASTLSHGGA
jgi:hypothetical protein